jgi:pimeloyl-ACP methyl ester carboxylesterase
MVPSECEIAGRRLRYAISDNESDVWAINVHGFFAGSSTYWRESSRLAEAFGWKVLTPSMPGFGGSDPLPFDELSMFGMATVLHRLMYKLRIKKAIVLGHSMGGAIGLSFAALYPEQCHGLIYRDGAGTPGFQKNVYMFPWRLAKDIPDFMWGKVQSIFTRAWPDVRHSVSHPMGLVEVGCMLYRSDCTRYARVLGEMEWMPVLCEWGTSDSITPVSAATEFGQLVGVEPIWVRGGHSWMLAHPSAQVHILNDNPQGVEFREQVMARLDA